MININHVIKLNFLIKDMIGDAPPSSTSLSPSIRVFSNFNEWLFTKPNADAYGVERLKVLSNGIVVSVGQDGYVRVWNTSNCGWSLISTSISSQFYNLIYSLDQISGDVMVHGGVDSSIHIWSIFSGVIRTISTLNAVRSLRYLNNGYLAAGHDDGTIEIWNINTGSLIRSFSTSLYAIRELETLNNELLSSASETTVRVWNLTSVTVLFSLTGHTSSVYALKRISMNLIASGDISGFVIIWDWVMGVLVKTLPGHGFSAIIHGLDLLSSDILMSGSQNGMIDFWNISAGFQLIQTFNTLYSITVLAPFGDSK